jgi:uncharacterized protein (TIRG00374 family)
MRIARLVLTAIGAALFVGLVVEIGPAAIAASFAELSWRLLIVLWFPFALITVFDTLGWKLAFQRDRVPFHSLLLARMAGEAVNSTTPTASIGGEAVKAWLLRATVPLEESLPSVIIAKTTITIAQALFLLVGIAVAWPLGSGLSPLIRVMSWMLVAEVIGVGGFVAVQVFGGAGRTGRLLSRFGIIKDGASSRDLARLDDVLVTFYRQHPGRLTLSLLFHFLGWAFSAVEVYMVLHFLGLDVSVRTALVIEAFGTGVRFASFMVPAHLGALEGGHVATFVALGLGSPVGLTFSLVRRVREMAWTGVGFLALSLLGAPAPVPALVPAEPEV